MTTTRLPASTLDTAELVRLWNDRPEGTTGNYRNAVGRALVERGVLPAAAYYTGEPIATAGLYTTPRPCVCGDSHIDRETYWQHRLAS